ncbi:MAG: CoA-transferase subunit beta [Candidatus Hodarchaeales archaeon]
MNDQRSYTTADLITCLLSREIRDDDIIIQGIATPVAYVAITLARMTTAPNMTYLFYLAVNPPAVKLTASLLSNIPESDGFIGLETFWDVYCRRKITAEIIRAAQVDGMGNLNNSIIGRDYSNPKVRLPGGAGYGDIVFYASNLVVYLAEHSKRVLPERVDFISGTGYPYREKEADFRTALGFNKSGVSKIITPLCVFEFNSGYPVCTSIHEGYDRELVVSRTGFDFSFAPDLETTRPPTNEEIDALNAKVDPLGFRMMEISDFIE